MKKIPNDSERLPVQSARLLAWLSLVMSIGFAMIAYFVVLSSHVSPMFLLVLIALVLVSDYIAMKRLMAKIVCEQCHQPFFNRVLDLFIKPKKCAACGYQYSSNVIE